MSKLFGLSRSDEDRMLSRLRQRIEFQSPNDTPDGAGGVTRGWQHHAYGWAEIRAVAGKETLADERLQSQITHRIVTRYRGDITAAMRVIYDSRVFNIRAVVDQEERSRFLELLAEEGVA